MSGIVSVLRRSGSVSKSSLREALSVLDYRGPDGKSAVVDGVAGLGHQHHYTVPAEVGETQPVEWRGVWIALDGRVDNRRELAAELGDATADVTTDAELLVAAYRQFGPPFLERVVGSFALALWDPERARLLVGRDKTGIRHVYYGFSDDAVVVGSEVEAVLAHESIPATVDDADVVAYLGGDCRGGTSAFRRHVRRLPPGARLVATTTDARVERYWEPTRDEALASSDVASLAREFRSRVTRAIRSRLRTAVPPAAMMSGGLDSTTVAALADRQLPDERLRAVSVVFDGTPEIDEECGVRAIESATDLDVTRVDGEALWPLRNDEVYDHVLRGHPCADTSLEIYDAACAEVTDARSILTGIGGNLADGDRFFYADLLRRRAGGEFLRAASADSMSLASILFLYGIVPLITSREALVRDLKTKGNGLQVRHPAGDRTPRSERRGGEWNRGRFSSAERLSLYSDVMDPYMDFALDGARQVALRRGVELLHPFLDARVVELLLSLPPGVRFRGRHKHLFRRSFADVLPDAILSSSARDNAYTAFVERGLRRAGVGDLCSSSELVERGYPGGAGDRTDTRRRRGSNGGLEPRSLAGRDGGALAFGAVASVAIRRRPGAHAPSVPADKTLLIHEIIRK